MKKIMLTTLMLFTAFGFAQVGINTETPDASSALDIESTTGGILIPRLTETQRDAISSPATGLMIYQTDQTIGFYFYDGTAWTRIEGVAGPQGEQGPVGADGQDGATGAAGTNGTNGSDGSDGNGIASTTDNNDGTFTLTFDDGSTFTTSDLTGPQGTTGAAGTNGTNGSDGSDGNGIASTTDNNDGTFTLTFDDGSTSTTSDLTGPQGTTGATGPQGETGTQGPIGPTGNTGPAGPQGPQGVPGTDGADGIDGEDGQGGVTTVSDGLTLSGSGTEADPYIISLPPGGTEGQLLTILNGVPVWADCNNPNTYYLDADDDGYGDPNNATSSCEPINGYVDNNTDCNDTNASVNPAATEIEDGIDNDCNGDLDEGFIESYGDQVWTLENADIVTYRDGTPIPEVTSDTDWGNLTTGAWAHYNNDTSNPRIYNGYAVMGIHDSASLLDETLRKEFSPEGWHVPTDEEWIILENQLIANGYNYDGSTTGDKLGKSMASTTGWNNNTETGNVGQNQSTNNSSGFNAFPEGHRDSDATFNLEGLAAKFWTATEAFDTDKNWSYSIYNDRSDLLKDWDFLKTGLSVRFVKD
jgi:uncharacterized protein (TIGR02145 family)